MKNLARVEHYKKKSERENINKLLSLLKNHGKLRFYDLKEKLRVSSPTLSQYLKELEGDGKIETFHVKGEDRRIRWYRIKPENRKNVETQLGKYEAIRFIEGISNPIYSYVEDGEKAIAVFMSGIDQRVERLAQKMADQMASQYLKFLKLKLLPNQKIATVIMTKGREGVES